MKRLKLIKEIPMLEKGDVFDFDMETGHVFGVDKGVTNEYPLRSGLAGYLWLLQTEVGYFKHLKR